MVCAMPAKTSQLASNDVFTAIAHPVRREILDHLSEKDLTVTTIAASFDISRPAISQHLAILLEVGLVSMEKQGRQNVYHLEPDALQEVERWIRHYERFWTRKVAALRRYLDRKADDGQA